MIRISAASAAPAGEEVSNGGEQMPVVIGDHLELGGQSPCGFIGTCLNHRSGGEEIGHAAIEMRGEGGKRSDTGNRLAPLKIRDGFDRLPHQTGEIRLRQTRSLAKVLDPLSQLGFELGGHNRQTDAIFRL